MGKFEQFFYKHFRREK